MSAANGIKNEKTAPSVLRRCWRNTAAAAERLTGPPRLAGTVWPWSLWQSVIVGLPVLVVIVLLMSFVDAAIAREAARLPHNVRWLFDQITDYGKSGWFLWPLGIAFLVLAVLPAAATRISQAVVAALMVRIGFLFLAIGAPGLFVTIVKRMIGRARPMVGGTFNPFDFKPFIWQAAYAGMPSGHATTAFSVLVAFGALWPRARLVLWVYALGIVASRIIVSAHYPSDVFAGAIVGTVGALMVRRYFALRRLGFSITPVGAVRRLPGPSLRRLKAVARGRRAL